MSGEAADYDDAELSRRTLATRPIANANRMGGYELPLQPGMAREERTDRAAAPDRQAVEVLPEVRDHLRSSTRTSPRCRAEVTRMRKGVDALGDRSGR